MTQREIVTTIINLSKELDNEPRLIYNDPDGDLHFLDINSICYREDTNNIEINLISEVL